MRSETKEINSVALNFLQRKNQITCRHCYDTVMGGRGRTVLDDSGTLAITAWTCARCGESSKRFASWGKTERRSHVRFGTPWRHRTRPDDQRRLRTARSGTEAEGWRWSAGGGYENGSQPLG
jgi:hypothetical protein